MNSETPQSPREELEVKLTALIVGELSADEAFSLGRAIEQDTELGKLYERLKKTVVMVHETSASPEEPVSTASPQLKLSDERRQKLLQQFKTVTPKEFKKPTRRRPTLIELVAMFAVIALLAAMLLPALSPAKMKTQRIAYEYRRVESRDDVIGGEVKDKDLGLDRSGSVTPLAGRSTPPATPALNPWPAHTAGGYKTDGGDPGEMAAPVGTTKSAPAAVLFSRRTNTKIVLPVSGSSEAAESQLRIEGATTPSVQVGGGGGGGGRVAPGQAAANAFAGDPAAIGILEAAQASPAPNFGGIPTLGRFAGREQFGEKGAEGQKTPPSDWFSQEKSNPLVVSGTNTFAYEGETKYRMLSLADGSVEPGAVPQSQNRSFSVSGAAAEDLSQKQEILDSDPLAESAGLREMPDKNLRGSMVVNGDGLTTWGATIGGTTQLNYAWADHNGSNTTHEFGALGSGSAQAPQTFFRNDGEEKDADAEGVSVRMPSLIKPGDSKKTVQDLGTARGITTDEPQSLVTALPEQLNQPEPAKVASAPSGAVRDRLEKSKTPRVSLEAPSAPVEVPGFEVAKAENFKQETDSDKRPESEELRRRLETRETLGEVDPSRGENLNQVSDLSAAVPAPAVVAPPAVMAPDVVNSHAADVTDGLRVSGVVTATNAAQTGAVGGKVATVDDLMMGVDPATGFPVSPAYTEKKRELDELQRSRQTLNLKIASEKIDAALPKTSMVQIVDRADSNAPLSSLLGGLFGSNVEKKARIKIERDQSDIAEFQGGAAHASAYDPDFMQTEFEVIQSDAVLGKVVEDLNLKETWAKKSGKKLETADALKLLKKKLDLRPQKSGLIDIAVKSEKPEEAANIANKVAEVYAQYRLEERDRLSVRGISTLEEGFAKQEQKVAQLQQEVEKLGKELIENSEAGKPRETDTVATNRPAAPALIPQPEVQTRDNAFSTFSLNVSDVSFKLAGASLEKGQMPEPASIRSEEFINAFDYRDPEPIAGVPVAFASEQARYPFAQNRDLLRFSIKTGAQGREAGRPLNLVLMLDNSGSMERADRVRIIREALRVLATQLQPQDKLSVVTFSRTARLWVDGVPGNQAGQVAEEVSGLTPEGGTNLEEAMRLAYETVRRHYLAAGINRVVLLTDGAANLGNVNPEALKAEVEAQRKQGVALDCFGIGWEGYNDDLLETLSRNGDGRYGFINTPEEAATEFAGQLAGALQVAASDVKVQVEFNLGRVTSYRQIGYAKHQLTKEQFRDNTVDAAEIAATESGNALYVVEINPRGEGPLATVRVRYKIPGTTDYREHEWAVPYNGNAVALEQSSPAMRLAASASAFSEWLAANPYAGEVSPEALLGFLGGVGEVYGADARPKKLEWMIRQAKSITGK